MRRFKDWPPWMQQAMSYVVLALFLIALIHCCLTLSLISPPCRL